MDSVDFKNMSLEERDCVAQEILRKRYAVDKPETLKLLAIKAICSNYKLFLKQNGNPLEILPGTIIKDFLGLIKEYRWTTHILIPKQDEMKFVLLLLNPNLTEFDPQEFNPYVRGSIAPHQVYYKHMVKNCPKITKIVKCCCRFCQGVVPLLKIAKFLKADLLAWKNLRYFGMKGTMCADRELQRISKYIPNLEGLEVSLSRHTLSTKAVKYFSKMKKLKHLDIGIMKCNYGCSIFYEHCPDMDLILKCLEKLSNLQTFQFDDTFDNFNNVEDFVESFGLFYPNKKLIAPRLNICSPFEFDWPENLLVKELEIHGDLSEGTIQKLISMPNFPKKLIIAVTPFRDIYPILEVLGPHLEELHFIDSDYVDFLDLDHGEIDLLRVIELCPNLEELYYRAFKGVSTIMRRRRIWAYPTMIAETALILSWRKATVFQR
ncbi:uncharacterized protein LOC132193418 isoform X2 [Neocloeon triangulifer]|uniref:uncharacterized protein LOC132193418 isoform X2 n=1 Tax=Neocloeon triangulifer TaxID=2078957 RepID=UPI00286EE851|nr:uncharacterized protein LOC132193418 isoform X2 [Neocloeon triangulifer]